MVGLFRAIVGEFEDNSLVDVNVEDVVVLLAFEHRLTTWVQQVRSQTAVVLTVVLQIGTDNQMESPS